MQQNNVIQHRERDPLYLSTASKQQIEDHLVRTNFDAFLWLRHVAFYVGKIKQLERYLPAVVE